ncbi:MAG: PRC-barrel domain-containing protein [Methanolobus sp.]|uniref:hemerythrin domain-containing protein n=1 Tax=Methanolobus sp. TaxID=1874737 RepID=UPI0027312AA8|nr:hemerythrin domain-containing protein [Methanolobus sp.]MDP2217259.1 PRC-barrel domain-containing protein [Methanolobus sp.]
MAVPEMLSVSSMEGDKIVNEKGENLGDIKDVMIDMQTGSVAYVVLSFGGFLGMGNKLFGVPLETMTKKPDEHAFILNIDKERLENAPGFDKDHWPGTEAGGSYGEYVTNVYDYYGYECPYKENIYGAGRGDQEFEEPGGRTLIDPLGKAKAERVHARDTAECTVAGEPGDIYSILKNEHDRVLNLFDEAINNRSKDTFMQIRDELNSHMSGEEEVLYPVLRDRDRTHDVAMEGYQEHHVAKLLLSELEVMDEKSDMWVPKMKVLKETVRHHVKEEEKQMFPGAQREMSKSESQEVARKYLDFKNHYRV